MIPLRLICAFLLGAVAGFLTARGNSADHQYSDANLKRLVVTDPDSVLSLMDDAQKLQSSPMPPYLMNLWRGRAYNEKRRFALADRYASEALTSDSIDCHPDIKLNLLTMLAAVRRSSADFRGCIHAATSGIGLARALDNTPAVYNLLTTMAGVSFDMGDRKRGYGYLDKIISEGTSSQSARELANVSSAYGMKIVELYADDRFDDALALSQKRLEIIDRIDCLGGAPAGYTDQQRAYTYARIASAAQMSGDTRRAQQAFSNFMATDYGRTPVGRVFVTDYLLESKQWAKVLEFTAPLFPMFEQGDTICDDFHSLLISNARAERGLGNYPLAFSLMERAGVVRDSIYAREKESRIREMATLFALNETELQLSRARSEAAHRQIMLIFLSVFAVAVLLIAAVLLIQYRRSQRRNRIASRRIDELTAQREIIHSRDSALADENYTQFEAIERTILESKRYLQSDYTRDSLYAECSGLPRSRVSQLIQQYAALTPADYINKLRVEHSVALIREHPEWTIDAIAAASGYPRKATYYSNFYKIYGLTPAQYRKEASASPNKCPLG